MRFLLIHNILWSHYKAKVFSDLNVLCKHEAIDFLVIQIAETMAGQAALSAPDLTIHRYPYRLLFKGGYLETDIWDKFFKIKKEIDKFCPTVCVLPGYSDPVFFLLTPYLMAKGITIVQTVDSVELPTHNNYVKELLKRLILRPARKVFTYGSLGEAYLDKLGIPKERIHRRIQATDNAAVLASAPLDVEKSTPAVVLYVGRINPDKGVEDLIKAFLAQPTNWQLRIVGDGPQRPELELVYGDFSQIIFTGPKPWDQLGEEYKRASLFVLPSHSDIWGLVVNEAMLFGLPVIVTDRCGCHADLIKHGVNGVVYPFGNIDALSTSLQYFMSGKIDLIKFGEKSKEIISEYTPEIAAEQMLVGIKAALSND